MSPTRKPAESTVNLLCEQIASTDDAAVEAGVKLLQQLINLGFEIPSKVTDLMAERVGEADPLALDVGNPDSEMISILAQLGIEAPATAEPPDDSDIPYGN